jgi:phage shock protein PspC (stress-responsive transcriptional regulator)
MRKVITISLNGNAYQIEEGGYDALQAYLESAQAKLHDDPDRAEILADLEQAIAEKCNRYLSPHKGVVSAEEMQQILTEMGPVNGQSADSAPGGAQTTAGPQERAQSGATDSTTARRLYQIHEGAMISGVCKGIAAYFNIDVAIVRLIFVALAILTWGAWILAYIVMMFVIPYASTSEERAAAHGQPFDAQHLIEEAKKQYASFKEGAQWRQQWRRQARAERRAWRREWRRGKQEMRDYMRFGHAPAVDAGDTRYAGRVLMGVMIPITALCNAALIIAFLVILAQLITHGTVFGWVPPPDVPLWADILILFVLLQVCTAPLRATRHYAYYAHGPSANVWFAVWGSILWIGFVIAFFWIAYHYWPDLAQFLQALVDSIRNHRGHAPGDSIFFSFGQLEQLIG